VRNHRSSAKQLNPSREVRIEPRRAADGSATWHVAIAPSAMQNLAKAAGVNEVDLSWLREPLEFMMFELQCQKWWMCLGHGPERTDQFIAFAEVVYRLAGFALRPAAIREQLKSAVKRRGVSGDEQRSERRV